MQRARLIAEWPPFAGGEQVLYETYPASDVSGYTDTFEYDPVRNVYDRATATEIELFQGFARYTNQHAGWHPTARSPFNYLLSTFVAAASNGWVTADLVGSAVKQAAGTPSFAEVTLRWTRDPRFRAWGVQEDVTPVPGRTGGTAVLDLDGPLFYSFTNRRPNRLAENVGPWAAFADCVVRRLWLATAGGYTYWPVVKDTVLQDAVRHATRTNNQLRADTGQLGTSRSYRNGTHNAPPVLTVYPTGVSPRPFLFEVNTGFFSRPTGPWYRDRWEYCDVSVASQAVPPQYSFAYWCPLRPSDLLIDLLQGTADLKALLAPEVPFAPAVTDWLQEYGVGADEADVFNAVAGWCRLLPLFAPFYRTGVLQ